MLVLFTGTYVPSCPSCAGELGADELGPTAQVPALALGAHFVYKLCKLRGSHSVTVYFHLGCGCSRTCVYLSAKWFCGTISFQGFKICVSSQS